MVVWSRTREELSIHIIRKMHIRNVNERSVLKCSWVLHSLCQPIRNYLQMAPFHYSSAWQVPFMSSHLILKSDVCSRMNWAHICPYFRDCFMIYRKLRKKGQLPELTGISKALLSSYTKVLICFYLQNCTIIFTYNYIVIT